MKKVFRNIFSLFFVSLMLFSVAFFDFDKSSEGAEKNGNKRASAVYTFESSGDYVTELVNSQEAIESQYNLTDFYPMINENQKDSDFCWIYSAYKSLESAFMVQKNEYYNFSETALAYSYFNDRVSENPGAGFNVGGNFETFATCYQNYGIALESDVSNRIYSDISSSTYRDYAYILDSNSKELNSYFKPYLLGVNSAFTGLASKTKIGVIKRFVKKYGAVFAGIQGGDVGCFYSDNSAQNVTRDVYKFYSYNRASHKDEISYQILPADHAITIVGWNDDIKFGADQGAFLVMNSWGFEEKSIQLFYVPYSYTTILGYTRGFICNDETQKISINDASESTFTEDFLKDSKEIKNFFAYEDEIWVEYKVGLSSFDSLEVKITSGNKNFNGRFEITADNLAKTVKVYLKSSSEFYGGYYTISFYNNEVLVGKRGIFIYSGTEINYLKGRTESANSLDDWFLDNAFASADNVVTINVASRRNSGGAAAYFFEFSRTPINNYNFIMLSDKAQNNASFQPKKMNMRVSEINIISSENPDISNDYTQEELKTLFFYNHLSNEMANLFRLQIGQPDNIDLSEFDDCLIQFIISVDSIIYENCTRDFVVNMFVSGRYNADSADLYNINYVLDGGDNNIGNPSKYPIYNPKEPGDTNVDSTMTEVTLLKPTRVGFMFVNWYLDKNYTQLVTKLDNNISGNITLYAKWESLNYNYFDLSLNITEVTNYDKVPKNPADSLVYGDSIVVTFNFVPVYMGSVNRNDYVVEYYFYGTEIVGGYLSALNTQSFELNFPDLKSGNHIFTVKVKVVYGLLEVVEEHSIAVAVAKKQVVFGFSETSKVYNGKHQEPTVSMVEDFYAEDFAGGKREDLFVLSCGGIAKDVDTYNFVVSMLNNKNYTFDAGADSSKCTLEITKKAITIEWRETERVYDGENHFPEYEVVDIVPGDTVAFQFNISECKNAGTYIVNILVDTISNNNYTASPISDCVYVIKKAKIKVVMHNTTDRIQTRSDLRNVPTFSIVGSYHSIADLQISIASEAMIATKSGTYPISCSILNENYEADVQRATYILTGYYNVYYLMSNGKTYTERVEEGEKPVGVTKEQLGVSKFSKISYSDDYVITGEDLYVEVEYKDYTFVVYTGIAAAIVGAIWVVYYFKKRESRVR